MTNIKLREKFTDIFELIGNEMINNETFNLELELFLDMLLDKDFFGTEGQCDPRGDNRNG